MLVGVSFTRIVFYFLFYCFVGWIIESTYVSLHQKKFVNRGFMRGPVIPIYGCGAMMLIACATPFLKYPVAVFFAGMIGCSALEYVTGAGMEAIFKVRYWDYSDKKFNLNGHVCLLNSFYWGVCSILTNYFLHKGVEKVTSPLSETSVRIITVAGSIMFIIDFTLSVKAALDLRSLIIKLDKAKDEMRILAKRLDVMVAYAGEGFEERKDKVEDRIDNWSAEIEARMEKASDNFDNRIDKLTDAIEERFGKIKAAIDERPQIFPESMKAEFYELKGKFASNKESGARTRLSFFKDFYRRGILRGNPTLTSKKYKDALDALKESDK